METSKAIKIIKHALELSEVDMQDIDLEIDVDLFEEGILDSLDAMTFLFNLEKLVNKKIIEIDEDFEDFKISSLVSILSKY